LIKKNKYKTLSLKVILNIELKKKIKKRKLFKIKIKIKYYLSEYYYITNLLFVVVFFFFVVVVKAQTVHWYGGENIPNSVAIDELYVDDIVTPPAEASAESSIPELHWLKREKT
jgi:hypothetical protein